MIAQSGPFAPLAYRKQQLTIPLPTMKTIHLFVVAALAAFGFLSTASPATAAPAAAKRVMTHEDLWLMKRVGAPQPSPDGKWLVVSVTDPAYEESAQFADLWLVAADRSAPARRLTSTRRSESGVTWSQDSRRIAFSTQREGDDSAQIYILDLASAGEAQRITQLTLGARSPVFSPDGRKLLFQSLVYPGAKSEADNKRLDAERKARKWNARIYEGFPIRNWDKWLDERGTHLFVQDLDASGAPVGEPRDLFAGTKLAALPGFSGQIGSGTEDFDAVFAPDSAAIVFPASINRDTAAYAFTNSSLYRQSLTGSEPELLVDSADSFTRPRFSADGKTLYALHEASTSMTYNLTRLAALSWPVVGKPRIVTASLDRAVSSYAIAPDSRTVFITAEDAGHEKLYRFSAAGGAATEAFAVGAGVITNIAIPQRTPRLAIYGNWESAVSPAEVVLVTPTSGTVLPLTQFNRARTAALELQPVEHFWFTSSKGRRIHNMIVRPPNFDPQKKYPLVVLIHGGPHTMWRDHFFLRWNYHMLAAPGYVILLTNYSGSTGFGEAAARTIQGDPLKTAGDETNEGADEAIKRYPFIDASRQCAGGASYGGHLANWLQASTTRYRCLISHAGLVNLESQWGTSDTIYSREINNGGPVWEQGPVWREQNPIRYAARFKTPTLVTIGEQDFRVPLNNSLEYWSALQRMRVPSRLVVFPDENHWVLKGENSKLFYRELTQWLGRYLSDSPTS
jgi:dipeptidyl aminopeptidase/acylaminoacyl peptidase